MLNDHGRSLQLRCWITDAAYSSDAESRMLPTAEMLNHGRYLQFRYWITEVQMLTRRSRIEFICWLTDFAHRKWQKSATDTESRICTDADSQILHIVNDRGQLHNAELRICTDADSRILHTVNDRNLLQMLDHVMYRCWLTDVAHRKGMNDRNLLEVLNHVNRDLYSCWLTDFAYSKIAKRHKSATDGESCGSRTIQMLTHIRLVRMYRMPDYGIQDIQDTFWTLEVWRRCWMMAIDCWC